MRRIAVLAICLLAVLARAAHAAPPPEGSVWTEEYLRSGDGTRLCSATIDLPFLRAARRATLDGRPAAKLEAYRREAPFELSEATIAEAETTFALPARLR
jgi:hypothetical protein